MPQVIAGLEVPETAAVAEATRLVQETTRPFLYHHSRRPFFFGLMHAHKLGVHPDPEPLYLAAMFHGTGLLTPFSDVEQRFELDSANHAPKFLLDRGFPAAAAQTIWTAVALHTTPGIPGRMAPEIATTHLGVLTDAIGFGLDGLEHDQLGEILAVHPRGTSRTSFREPTSRGSRIASKPRTCSSTSSPASSARRWSSASSAHPGRANRTSQEATQ